MLNDRLESNGSNGIKEERKEHPWVKEMEKESEEFRSLRDGETPDPTRQGRLIGRIGQMQVYLYKNTVTREECKNRHSGINWRTIIPYVSLFAVLCGFFLKLIGIIP